MAKALFRSLATVSSLRKTNHCHLLSWVLRAQEPTFRQSNLWSLDPVRPQPWWGWRNLSHGSVSLVISQGKAKFEIDEVDPPKKEKWQTKKRLKMKRMREKLKRKSANKNDPRRLAKKRKKRFANPEERIMYKLQKAKLKESLLIERLTRYEVPKVQGPVVEPVNLTGEERFFLKKMAQKKSNYAPIGRRGVFGGVILNMHMHWKRHETVKVICNSCKPGQIHDYAQEIARLSGGVPIQIIGDDTIVFYRGKGYVRPEVMSPIDTLSKKKAYEKSKYEQSLDSVQQFIAICEKELELYLRHIALYGNPDNRNPVSIVDSPREVAEESEKPKESESAEKIGCAYSARVIEMKAESTELELSETDDESDYFEKSDSEGDSHLDCEPDYKESSSSTEECCTTMVQSCGSVKQCDFDSKRFH